MEHPSQPRSFRIEGHVMNSTLYFSKVGEFSYWGQSPIVQGHSAFPMTGNNQFSATGTGGFLNGDSEYRFSNGGCTICSRGKGLWVRTLGAGHNAVC